VSGQLQTPAALSPLKELSAHIGYDAGWAVLKLRLNKYFVMMWNKFTL
jgi:hypothetical protein